MLLDLITAAARDKKAQDMVVLKIGEVSLIADYFVIATGNTKLQQHAIADNIMEKVKAAGYPLLHKEGYDEGLWILLDYGSVVVHLFQPEARDFYKLERLWSHAPGVEPAAEGSNY
ncbi:MAG TPA: ribosome silencing factor [Firmicutes bacterium]|nr:ribosome silencing factor [Bacillota bacterium]